jgi:hypothetical protein
MKMRARVPLYAGDNARFSPDLAEKLIGQTTADGWTVLEAEYEGSQTIWLVVEGEGETSQELQSL